MGGSAPGLDLFVIDSSQAVECTAGTPAAEPSGEGGCTGALVTIGHLSCARSRFHHIKKRVPLRPVFPSSVPASAAEYVDSYTSELVAALGSIDRSEIQRALDVLIGALANDATVFCCGNGGSAAVANHMACDHQKGVASDTQFRPRILSLASNEAVITAVGNDIGFDDIFAHSLRLHGRGGDVLVTISSSGNSENIVRALSVAKEIGMSTIAMTGFNGGRSRDLAEVSIHVDSQNYGIVEDAHQSCMHMLAQILRLGAIDLTTVGRRFF